ncbi:unnamed protein product [Cladocopium goreaui]|uniref:Reverse transcriptase domain-containing protein n=1 Tax=Cladocopium goreaui TaxID=2562237 RepID=A0A9P1DNX8_9DINO|nr:unnamed protein product [Cladocopium goreaui]
MSVLSESSDSSPEPASIGQGQAGASGAGDRRDVEPSQETPVLEGAKNAMWPDRVKAALGEAQDFGKFREKRTFKFLHLFSGPDDRLAAALVEEGKKANLVVSVDSIDIKKDPSADLRKNEVMDRFEAQVSGGNYDGFHAGFPCGSFSRVRWVQRDDMPGPVRSREHPYGLPSNTPAQQDEADHGTLMATRSMVLMQKQTLSQRSRRVPQAATAENPPGDEDGPAGSAWMLQEVAEVLELTGSSIADFNTCSYMTGKERYFKPARWVGRLENLDTLARVCRCPAWVRHIPVTGKSVTVHAGVYPDRLCEEVAKLYIAAWKRTLELEFWRWKLTQKAEEISTLKEGWLRNEEKRISEKQASMGIRKMGHVDEVMPEIKKPTAMVDMDPEKETGPSSSTGMSKKQRREAENEFCVGGMRNPLGAVKRLWKVKNLGKKIRLAWEEFMAERPGALTLGERYGSTEAQFDQVIAMEWQVRLSTLLGVKQRDGITLRDKLMFKSPLNVDLWRAWFKETGDPDYHVAEWAEEGVPLGMNVPIPPSNGVYPTTGEITPEFMEEGPEIEMQSHLTNYKSFVEAPEDAEIEVQRYVEKGFAILMDWEEVQSYFDKGTVSRLALILKEKPDGSMKRRVVVDLLRSGGNSRTTTPERIVLPRIVDVTRMARDMAVKNEGDNEDRSAEFVMFDLQDAFCHFPVCREELSNCLAPGNRENQAILFRALLFGFKSAPLLMGRLSAAVGRLWQSLMSPTEGQMQIYVDDVLTLINGTDDEKANLIALGLYTMKAFGVQIALAKGERGQQVQWIGVKMLLQWPESPLDGSITYSAPKKMIEEIVDTLRSWQTKGMVSHRELRSTTGRLSWVAGILPRLRWAVSVLFAVLQDAEEDERMGAEDERAQKRQDNRPKYGLVAVKRFGATVKWLIAILSKADKFERPVTMGILTDASPLGLGAVLVHVDTLTKAVFLVEAFEAKFSLAEATLLGVEHGESSSQGILEALAVFRAVKLWRTRLQDRAVFVRSDSVVALAMTRKLASSTPALNHLGGELAIALEQFNILRLVPQHIPGVMNLEPDWLSRPHDRAEAMPDNLKKIRVKQLAPVTAEDFALPPPGDKIHPWEGLPPHNVSVFHNL